MEKVPNFFSSIEVANFSIDEDNNLNILSIFPKQFVSKKESETSFFLFFFFTNYVLKVMIKVKLGKRSQSDRKGQWRNYVVVRIISLTIKIFLVYENTMNWGFFS